MVNSVKTQRRIPFGGQRLDIRVRGMHCASCVGTVEAALRKTPGVVGASVNLADERAQVTIDPAKIDKDEVYRRIRVAGYEPLDPAPPAREAEDEAAEARRELRWTIAAAVPAAFLAALMFAPDLMHDPRVQGVSLVLATLVQFGPGLAFYSGAARALRAGRPNMDVLVALGITAAYGISLAAYAGVPGLHGQMYFETSAVLVAFIRLGKWLEARARGRAGKALRALLALEAPFARRVPPGGTGPIERVRASEVQVGDVLEVLPGEKVPADGVVTEGRSAVDESMVTGESRPVEKAAGVRVLGASVNRSGVFRMRADRIGDETLLAQIVAMVRAAQADRAPIQQLADRVSAWFVPGVLALALGTLAFWLLVMKATPAFAATLATAVVVIACPCALGLATPTAILVGSGIGLRRGILIKRASALEALARIRTILLDKTGTLTRGRFEVTDTHGEGLEAAAALAARSTHPLARAIVARVEPRGAVEDVEEEPGRGLSGTVDGERVQIGSRAFLAERFVEVAPALAERAAQLEAQGRSTVWVARGGDATALIGLADTPRPEAAEVVRDLRALGLEVGLVSGDIPEAARATAAALGIEQVHAQVPPDGKQAVVKAARGPVAFVGDGINDAPALAAADVGIAIGAGTDVAKETGDVVLVKDDLRDIVRAVLLGRATLRKVRQNLFLAFAYNVAAIPIAMGALYPAWGIVLRPEIAGLAMALSSVSVVTNALTLRRVRRTL